MSKESLQWLNSNTLIGCTDKRGTAWHWRAQEQGERSNHYPGAIPVPDVQDRLFPWTAQSRRVAVETPSGLAGLTHSHDGAPMRWQVVPDRQAICRSDDDTVLGIFGPGYTRHQYREWLPTTVADLLDDDLAISSAGLLRGGAIAWVEYPCPTPSPPPKAWRSARTCWPPPASTAASPPPTNGPSPTPCATTPANSRCPSPLGARLTRPPRYSELSSSGVASPGVCEAGRSGFGTAPRPHVIAPRLKDVPDDLGGLLHCDAVRQGPDRGSRGARSSVPAVALHLVVGSGP